MTPEADDKKARLKKGCAMAVIVLAVLLFMMLFIPPELVWVLLLIGVPIEAWIISRMAKGGMEKKLGRKLKGEHELTSLTSWIEASKDDEVQKPK